MLAGFTNSGIAELALESSRPASGPSSRSVSRSATCRAWGMPVGREHLLGHGLVHAQRRAEHAAADVGHAGQLEQALHGAVLAQRAVQQREARRPARPVGRASAPAGSTAGRRSTAARRAARRDRPPGPRPRRRPAPTGPRLVMADRRDVVALGSAAAQHVAGRHQRDTSCSADWPPKSTTSRMRVGRDRVVGHGGGPYPAARPRPGHRRSRPLCTPGVLDSDKNGGNRRHGADGGRDGWAQCRDG